MAMPASHPRHPPHGERRPPPRDAGRLRDPRGGRQRRRCGSGGRDRPRGGAQRHGAVRGRRPDHDLPRRGRARSHDQWPRLVATGGVDRALRLRVRRSRSDRHPPHRRPSRARRLDAGPPALRDDELRRRRGGLHPLRMRRVLDAPRDARVPDHARGRLPELALERGNLPSGRATAEGRGTLRAGRPCGLHPVHGG